GDPALRPKGWAGRHWSPATGAEHRAARERAALFDQSSFAKIEVSGPGAAAYLERMCGNQVAGPVGGITYTQMLNRRGGIEADLTVSRWASDRFWLVTGTAFGTYDLEWLRSHLPDRGVELTDITPDTGPYEAGLGFAVRLDKPGGFIGRDAAIAANARGLERRLCCLVLADPLSVALGNEPVRVGGRIAGRVTSGGYGYTVGRS